MMLMGMLPMFGMMVWGYDIAHVVIAAIVICGAIAIGYIIITEGMGIAVPPWVKKVLWIIIAVIIGVVAIKIIIEML